MTESTAATTRTTNNAIYPHIVVSGQPDRPYYSIHWYDVDLKSMICGYGSYNVNIVRGWLETEFNIIDKEPDNLLSIKLLDDSKCCAIEDSSEYISKLKSVANLLMNSLTAANLIIERGRDTAKRASDIFEDWKAYLKNNPDCQIVLNGNIE